MTTVHQLLSTWSSTGTVSSTALNFTILAISRFFLNSIFDGRTLSCPACIEGTRSGAFKSIEGCSSKEPFEYKIIKCTDTEWIKQSKFRGRNLACNLFNPLKNGDVIVFDPMLASGSRRQCRFDIGQVTKISYPYDIEISVLKSITPTEYIWKQSVQNIQRDVLRFKFLDNPIMQNKIVLNGGIFTAITKNF